MPDHDDTAFQLGDWRVEPSLNQISRAGENVNVPPRAMDVLVYLKSRAGEVASFDDLIEHVWDGAFVTNGSIYNSVNELRKAFGEQGDSPAYIETIPKRGYRLIASISEIVVEDATSAEVAHLDASES